MRTIARGALHHRPKVKGKGEVGDLAKAIDRMAHSLQEAQDTEIELGLREREREVALEVADSLRPEAAPQFAGVTIAMDHVAAPEPGGDFYDFQETPDGKLALMVCDVSGAGVPGALVGATARAYLKAAFATSSDIEKVCCQVNRQVARDVRRGMYVTALIVLFDPKAPHITLACSGHKLPLVHCVAETGKVQLIQPEGIALGFDKGPIFDRSLQVKKVPFAPGDRLVLASTGVVGVQNPDGEDFGEPAFYKAIARNGKEAPDSLLDAILAQLETFADEEPYPADLSMVAVARQG